MSILKQLRNVDLFICIRLLVYWIVTLHIDEKQRSITSANKMTPQTNGS